MSTNPFDEFERAAPANPFDEFAPVGPSTRQVLKVATQTNPDDAAEVARLAKRYPAPNEVLLRNLRDVKLQAAVDEADRKLGGSPKLAEMLRQSPFVAQQTHDDIDPLVAIEKATAARADRTAMGTLGDVGVVALKGAVGLPQALVGLADIVSGGYAGKGVEAAGIRFEDAQQFLDTMFSPAQRQANDAVREAEGFLGTLGAMLTNPSTIATTVGESAPQMLGGAAIGRGILAAAPKLAPWLAAAFGEGLMGAGATAEQLRAGDEEGLLSAKTTLASLGSGAGTALFGAVGGRAAQRLGLGDIDTALVARGVDDATAKTLTKGFAASIAKAGISEGVFEELPQSVQEQMWQNWATDKPLGQGVGKAAAQGLLAGLSMGGGFQAVSEAGATLQRTMLEREAAKASAEAEAQRLAEALKAAAASKLRERNPETFQQLVQQMAEQTEGAPQTVFIDAQVLMQSATPEQIAQLLPSTAEQLDAAVASNGMVEVPISEALTALPGTPLEQVFLQNARANANALSLADAQQASEQAGEFLKAEADRVLAEAQDQATWQAEADAVKAAVLADLNAAARFSPEANEAYAVLQSNFFSTMAARVGLTPQALFERYRLKVAVQGQGGQVLNAGGKPGEITVEGYHYSKAARPMISTRFYGTGLRGSNRDLYLEAEDKRLRNRAYFYVDKGTGINPESGVGGVAQRANLANIYDSDADPLGLKKGANQLAFESAVLDAGFSGYLARMDGTQSGQVILLGDQTVQTEVLGPMGRIEAGQRVEALPREAPQWKTQASGEPAQLQARLERMLANPSWANYDIRIEGRELQVREKGDGVFNQSATIRRGTETLKKYGLKPGQKYKTREVAAALEARQRAKYGTIAADDRSPEALANIAKWMQAEVEFAMDNPESSGVGWYSEKFQRALDTMAQQFPELATDKTARNTMTALIAITSDGQKVVPNFAQAMDIYGNFKANGKFTTTRGHQRQASINANLEVMQRLHDQMGAEAMHEYLMQEKTISELKKIAKANGGDLKSDYQAHIKMPMAAVEFGPKLGAFYANLMGAHGYLTMDRWWSRTFNRYRGTLLQAPTRQGLDRFKELLGNPAMSDDEAIAATVEPRNAYEAKGFKSGTELEKAANTIYKAAFENLEDSPFNATDRTFMLDAVNKAQKSLARKGYNLSVADIQAILWYYEKRLYGELGARQTADISYEEAAQRVVAGYASGSGIESLLDDTAAAPEDGGADQGRVPVGEETFDEGSVNGGQPEQAGDRAGREAGAGPAPLPGAPVIEGATGPDPRLVAVAEQYARDNGIDLKRQAAYVEVDPERAARIAAEYDKMAHAPNDPAVREAYQNLIEQTVAQYRALEAAGYKFWFIDPTNDPYKSPFDAMREMRASQTMGVFPTVAGFGSGATDVDTTGNPLEADTGILWPYGSPDGELKPVLANDLFRAVHDAFGHGLEGAGFRAQGEENAWQAHIRLFTGSAKGAITSETRGQNSWLNYGPYGEKNRTAKVEDTVFADQKTGLMPEWTWTEGVVGDFQGTLEQGPRGTFNPQTLLITLNESANLSTFLHESGHFFLEVMADLASQPNAPAQIQDDMAQVLAWFGVPDLATWNSYTLDQKRPYHERFAESIEQYFMEGKAPSAELQPVFRRFRSWLLQVYKSLKAFVASRVPVTTGGSELGQGVAQTDTPEFKAWFGDSAVRVPATSSKQKFADQPPLVVYHGTRANFDAFAPVREGNVTTMFGDEETVTRHGIFFAEDPDFAATFAKQAGAGNQTIVPVYLSIQNPLYLDEGFTSDIIAELQAAGLPEEQAQRLKYRKAEMAWAEFDDEAGEAMVAALRAAGYDGALMVEPGVGLEGEEQQTVWVALDPTQIKSATGNDGTFDANDPSILSQGTPPTGPAIQLNDEIRKVFDRMLATDEQIAAAEQDAGMLPDFDATNEAIEQLQTRSMRDMKWLVGARNKAIKALQKQAAKLRKAVEDEVREEVDAMPVYAARKFLRTVAKLDVQALAEMYGGDGDRYALLDWKPLTSQRLAGKEGLHPDMAAEMFGFTNGDALVRELLAAEPIDSVIEGMTDQRMLERHGDLVDQRAIEEAANAAVHNEARARMLATELKAQSDALNPRTDTGRTNTKGSRITVNALQEAAKQFAANLTARRKLKDLKNAAWQHTAAERRASKRWVEATAKGDTQAAVQAKRDQLLNNLTAKAMAEAQAEVKKIEEFFAKVTKGNDEKVVKGGRDPDVVNAMRAMLAAYGIAPRLEKQALEYMEAVRLNDPAMFNALAPSVQAATLAAKPFGELTLEELRGLNEELRAMWLLAKRSRQMEVDGNLLDLDDAADQLMARMTEIGVPDTIPGERGAITDAQERGIKLRFFKAILSRAEQWAERLDGKFGGPFLRLVFQPIKEAADRYRTARIDYRQRFTALLENLAPAMPRGPINAPELGYTFGSARDSGVAELLHAILHTGNDSNKRKLLLGRGWATENPDGTLDTSRWDAFINRMHAEGRIGKEHYDFAQGVWDLLEEMKPLAQEAHRKVYGRYFAEVTANEVATPFGNYRGGYVPAQTDARIVKDAKLRELAEGENESMAYAFPSSPNGFTKARVDYNKPLLLDLRALAQHMDKVLLFSHMQPAVNDVRRLLTAKRVSYALDRIDPSAYEGMLIPWLNRAAKQIVETPVVGDRRLSRFLSAARSRAGMALMFANLSNTVQQITGFSMAAVKVKPSLMLKATAEFTRSPKAMKQTVADASAYMKDRMLNENAAMIEATEQILTDPTLLERGQAWTQRHAYFMQAAVDNTMSPIIWTAAYNQAIEQGMDERDAVRFADGTVRQTQGSTLPEDVSRFETGPGYARLFTQFVSYFNMMANTNATAVKQIADEIGLRKGAGKLAYVALAGLLAPIWVAELIANAFRGGPEDEDDDGYLDDWLMAVFGIGTLRGLVAQVPIAGQMVQLAVNRFNDNPADDKFSLSPAVSLIESSVSAPRTVYDAIVEDGNKAKALRDTAAAATMVTGLPIYGALRPAFYLTGIADDRVEPTGPVDFARGLVTGTASPESKQ